LKSSLCLLSPGFPARTEQEARLGGQEARLGAGDQPTLQAGFKMIESELIRCINWPAGSTGPRAIGAYVDETTSNQTQSLRKKKMDFSKCAEKKMDFSKCAKKQMDFSK
jgi:hypothetical protein